MAIGARLPLLTMRTARPIRYVPLALCPSEIGIQSDGKPVHDLVIKIRSCDRVYLLRRFWWFLVFALKQKQRFFRVAWFSASST